MGWVWARWLALVAIAAVAVVLVALSLAPVAGAPIEPTPSARPDDAAPRVVVIGQSPTSDPGGWPGQLANARGFEVVALLTSDSSYLPAAGCSGDACRTYADLVTEAIALDPDYVVVAGGASVAGVDQSTILSIVRSTLAGLRVGLPDATILAAGPLPDAADQTGATYLDGVIRQVTADLGLSYVSLSAPPVVLAPDSAVPPALDAGGAADVASRVAAALP
ncbi:hypothetical protein DDQ50_05370 [Amnibacterium flavum]|uniref:SGNH hydrolase-type esterase domain-containing protein n=1 Tax=Amnibacterium flavum TaxID=2173173 RepID=A0A2V1HTG5_9MICO|nr:hypothetical protein DDQ50_05370 [Amnibacterium flavum]